MSEQLNNKLEILYEYIDNYGWYLFPQTKFKTPFKGMHGYQDATKDKNKIKEWHEKWPWANWAVATGKKSGIIAFDIDPRNGGTWAPFGDRKTLADVTGGGGNHLFYKYPDFEVVNNPEWGEGIELMSDGKAVTIPPSIHENNNKYTWFNKFPIAEIDREFIESGKKPSQKEKSNFLPDTISEERNNTLTSIAGKLRQIGFNADEILASLNALNESRCENPLDEKEVRNIAYSMERYERGEVEEESTPILKSAKQAFEWREPKKFIIEDVIPEGSVSVWVGKYGSKKTFSCFSAAVCVALGKPWTGHKTIQSPVLFIDEENGEYEVLNRLQRGIIGEDGDENVPVYYTSLVGFNLFKNLEDVAKIKNLAIECGAKLVFIDSLRDVMVGGKEKDAEDMQIVFMNLRKIAEETKIAFVVLHHENRSGTYSGSTAIPGAVDIQLNIKSEKGSSLIKFDTEKVRSAEPFKFNAEIRFDGEHSFCMNRAEDETPFDQPKNENEALILEYFKAHNGEAILKELLDTVPSEKYGSVRATFYKMVDDKKFNKLGETKRGKTKYKMS